MKLRHDQSKEILEVDSQIIVDLLILQGWKEVINKKKYYVHPTIVPENDNEFRFVLVDPENNKIRDGNLNPGCFFKVDEEGMLYLEVEE